LRQLFTPAGLRPSSANGAPIHLLRFERSKRSSRAQTLSLLTHLAAIATILSIASQNGTSGIPNRNLVSQCLLAHCCIPPRRIVVPACRLPGRILAVVFAPHRLPIADSSHHDRQYNWLRQDCRTTLIILCRSRRRFSMRKRLRWSSNREMWLALDGRPDQFGRVGRSRNRNWHRRRCGRRRGARRGQGSEQSYSRGVSLPTCFICPYPIYTDEARKTKIQGTVTLRVLVGADGRASDIRVVRASVWTGRARSANRSRLEIQAGTRRESTPGDGLDYGRSGLSPF